MEIQGKGFYIWQIRRTEAADPQAIANAAVQAGLTHVLIKIADGDHAYNLDSDGKDLVPPLVAALSARGIQSFGWHYVYGYEPELEADIALQRISQTGVSLYVIDAEDQYKQPGRAEAATKFMNRLRASRPTFPMALSSYRYPTYHATFPWQEFLAQVDYNMPQVYWVQAENPGAQLTRCLREFEAISPMRPIIPTGSAYVEGDWQPTPAQVIEFMNTARSLNMPAANYWEWAHTRLYLPDLWQTISDYAWPVGPSGDIVDIYFAALNAGDTAALAALYLDNAVLVTPDRSVQGREAIRVWHQARLSSTLSQASFSLGVQSGSSGARHFSWTATSSKGNVSNGTDSFGLVDGRIAYHYTYFTVTAP